MNNEQQKKCVDDILFLNISLAIASVDFCISMLKISIDLSKDRLKNTDWFYFKIRKTIKEDIKHNENKIQKHIIEKQELLNKKNELIKNCK